MRLIPSLELRVAGTSLTFCIPGLSSLAKDLYSKDSRFVLELLQNADENCYTKARAVGSAPYAALHLYSKKLVIECNEDGFTETDVRALCGLGNNSHAAGTKGIGFRSVFAVAWKAHIQSGDYSFAFIHRPGDSGMGMISPEWESGFDRLPGNLTRTTLHLLDGPEAATKREAIRQQLDNLEMAMLLFSRNVQRIQVHVYDDDDVEVSSITMSAVVNHITHMAVLTRCRTQNGSSDETRSYCHVTKLVSPVLEWTDKRTHTALGGLATANRKLGVILAFPLTEDAVPIIEAQHVFSLLPIRRLGFNVRSLPLPAVRQLAVCVLTFVVYDSRRLCHLDQQTGRCHVVFAELFSLGQNR